MRRISLGLRAAVAVLAAIGADACLAQSSEFIDSAANVLALFVIFAVPVGGIVLFWLVHVLPEKVAEKRHHPQKDAIRVLCFLSLVFGGLLWPLAWLWAYSKPVLYKLAYGRDRHDEYYADEGEGEAHEPLGAPAILPGTSAAALRTELADVSRKLAELDARGDLPVALIEVRNRLAALDAESARGSTKATGAG
jgi:hypothetical protein